MSPTFRRIVPRLAVAGLAVLASLGGGSARASDARLGRNVLPVRQIVSLQLDPAQANYRGTVRIELHAGAAADSFQMNARHLQITRASMVGPSGPTPVTVAAGADERITVVPGQRMTAGDYTLDLEFTNAFDTHATGLYRVQYAKDWYAYTQFEAIDARQAFPCFDEPSFKIPWRLTLTVPTSAYAIANTDVENMADRDGQRVFEFAESRPMPSYLVAFAVGPFDVVPVTGLSFPTGIVTPRGQAHLVDEAARMTPKLMSALESYFKRPYPYDKLHLLAVPEFTPGAMENPGAITFANQILLLDPKATTAAQRRRLAEVLAHEMAHLWFGDLVTMEWWDDLWLNESFATWMGNKIVAQVYPEFEMPVHDLQSTDDAYAVDDQPSARVVRQPINATVDLYQMADALAYDKGQAVLGMFEHWMGDETFRTGVVDYVSRFAWKNATATDLWDALSRASKRDVGAAMATFLDQPGVPLVTVTVLSGGKVRLNQQRYRPYGVASEREQRWSIPMVLKFSDGKKTYTQSVLLTEASQTITLKPAIKPAWLHPNASERGYYHWTTETPILQSMARAHRSALDSRERLGFLIGWEALLKSGQVHGDEYLTTTAQFADDPQPLVVDQARAALNGVKTAFVTEDLEEAWARYIRRTFRPTYDRIGHEARPGEPENIGELRATLMATLGDDGRDPEVRAQGEALARAWLDKPNAVDPSLVDVALRLSALNGDAARYADYVARISTAQNPVDRRRMLQAVGFFRGPDEARKTLDLSMSEQVRPTEMVALFQGWTTPALRQARWANLQARYDQVIGRVPPAYHSYLPSTAFECSADRVTEARSFFSGPRAAGMEHSLDMLQDRITNCVSLREREGPRAAKVLQGATAAQ